MYDTTPRLMARQPDVIRLPQVAPNGCDDCSVESGEKHRYAECPGHQRRATPTSDRYLLAEVSRWRKANGWTEGGWRGWQDARYEDGATVAVRPNEAGFQVWRKSTAAPHFTGQPTEYAAGSLRQAIDLLVALGILPAHFARAHEAGVASCQQTIRRLVEAAMFGGTR